MKIEFLKQGSEHCPLIRIFGTDSTEFAALCDAMRQLVNKEGQTCGFEDLPGFSAVSACALTLVSSSRGESIRRIENTHRFVWTLTQAGWDDVAYLIEPFALHPQPSSFQWLAGPQAAMDRTSSPISILISRSAYGTW